ncbi:MAG: hypothetical protein LBI70_00400 [Rickettsiales bacterium]|jgi:hypothetical protein|nr:hypothetical protein [Rickettsiales bacterium]
MKNINFTLAVLILAFVIPLFNNSGAEISDSHLGFSPSHPLLISRYEIISRHENTGYKIIRHEDEVKALELASELNRLKQELGILHICFYIIFVIAHAYL